MSSVIDREQEEFNIKYESTKHKNLGSYFLRNQNEKMKANLGVTVWEQDPQ